MLHSYDQEIREKRRAARIFWAIVFLFAFFLYFFFQGYYPSIRFGLETIERGHIASGESIIQSFGIVNIRSIPADSSILFESGALGNDEKRMVKYGTYTTHIAKDGYLPLDIRFTIDKAIPYFIEIAHMLPAPRYTKWTSTGTSFSRVGESWYTESGGLMYLYDSSFSGASLLGTGSMKPIGEGYFLSGTILFYLGEDEQNWVRPSWSGATTFIKNCPTTPYMQYGNLLCEGKTLLRSDGKKIVDIEKYGNGYTLTASGLTLDGEKKIYAHSGIVTTASRFISYNYIWYGLSGSTLVPVDTSKNLENIELGLDQVDAIQNKDGVLMAFGLKGKDYFLHMRDGNTRTEKQITIAFPHIDLTSLRIENVDGNYFFKARNTLLFMYHSSHDFHWIVDGEVLAFSKNDIIYRDKDGTLWKANWLDTSLTK